MGFEDYAVLGYRNRKNKLSSPDFGALILELVKTGCYTMHWMKWYGSHVDKFDSVLLAYSNLAEFILLIIGEEGNMLEVVSYRDGKMTKSEFSLISLEVFTGYTLRDFNKLKSKEIEKWTELYDDYRRKAQSLSAKRLNLALINVEAPDDDSSAEESPDDDAPDDSSEQDLDEEEVEEEKLAPAKDIASLTKQLKLKGYDYANTEVYGGGNTLRVKFNCLTSKPTRKSASAESLKLPGYDNAGFETYSNGATVLVKFNKH